MWGGWERRKSKLGGKVVTEAALLCGIFYSKFQFQPNSVLLQLNKQHRGTPQATPGSVSAWWGASQKTHWSVPNYSLSAGFLSGKSVS